MLRIGTRGSPLALWQANHVADLLRRSAPGATVELVIIQTAGDQVRDVPLAQLGGEGVFTKAIQDAVLDERVDLAVHSLKDLPTIPIDGLILAAVPERAPSADVFLSRRVARFDDLPPGGTIATGSLRRRAQALHRRPDLNLVDIRGNVETRLKKLATGDLDGLILAQAGLLRLGLGEHITEVLSADWMLPAVGQGALGLECRTADERTRALVGKLDEPRTHAAVLAERSLLRHLGGGCQVPLGVRTEIAGEEIGLMAAVVSTDGKVRLEDQLRGELAAAEEVGRRLAERMLERGARVLLGA